MSWGCPNRPTGESRATASHRASMTSGMVVENIHSRYSARYASAPAKATRAMVGSARAADRGLMARAPRWLPMLGRFPRKTREFRDSCASVRGLVQRRAGNETKVYEIKCKIIEGAMAEL